MSFSLFILCSVAYVLLLFGIAYLTDKKAKGARYQKLSPYIYALSLAVYCTAWTFYGSVGKAAKSGFSFLTIYIGPTLFVPLWFIVLRKIILISKHQRITSIADFISSRYGKSAFLGVLATLVSFFGVIPYIALQLKAVSDSFMSLANFQGKNETLLLETGVSPFYTTAFYVAVLLTIFTILFGARNLDPNERHEGMITAIAFESLIKLVAFLAIGIFVVYGLYNGLGDIFEKVSNDPRTAAQLHFSDPNASTEWFWLSLLSLSAIILLPRQFHVAVVENAEVRHLTKAMWLFPLYLLIINIFVLPVALAGVLHFGNSDVVPDTYLLEFSKLSNHSALSFIVFIGGFSAAASMVIVETTALSIMFSNHILMPPLVTYLVPKSNEATNLPAWILAVRRISICFIMLLAFSYLSTIAKNRELISIGLVSFAAMSQFTPSVFLGIFWRRATKSGAIAGLLVGSSIWAITLPLPMLVEYGYFDKNILTDGYFSVSWLKPFALFGLEGFDKVPHSAFWSLSLNLLITVVVSLLTSQTAVEAAQADIFVNIRKYVSTKSDFSGRRREAKRADLDFLLTRFLGEERKNYLWEKYETENNLNLAKITRADAALVNYVETHLAGAIGAASAQILMQTFVKEEQIGVEELLDILSQTQEVIVTNKKLAETTHQLQIANDQLKELDRMKADFITTVTHELRTPMTSIRAFAKILKDNENLPKEKRDEFLRIVVDETERITRLINQVLDIEKISSHNIDWQTQNFDLIALCRQVFKGFEPIFEEKNIESDLLLSTDVLFYQGDKDRISQVLINLLSNASKFTNTEGGIVAMTVAHESNAVRITVRDNGNGIPPDKVNFIFERFTQIEDDALGKPQGSGLGLYITQQIINHHGGSIGVLSKQGEGAAFIISLPIQSGN